MRTPGSLARLLAVLLVVVLTVTVASPARAEAADVLTILAITALVIAGVVIIAYLVIANVEGPRRAVTPPTIWLACAGADCPLPAAAARPPQDPIQAP